METIEEFAMRKDMSFLDGKETIRMVNDNKWKNYEHRKRLQKIWK